MKSVFLSRGMLAMLAAQFVSVMADNALLFVAIGFLKSSTAPAWQIPFLQETFLFAFILLAPFIGPFADALPKWRVMLLSNFLKMAGAGAMFAGLSPLLAYSIVGLGAAAYATAKMGLLPQMLEGEQLVKANSYVEGSSVVGVLLGAVCGGFLADQPLSTAAAGLAALYVLAGGLNLLMPRLPASHPETALAPKSMARNFLRSTTRLLSDRSVRLSIVATSTFWSAGVTLRVLLVLWVPVALNIHDLATPARLSGIIGIGIFLGALLVARVGAHRRPETALPAGLLAAALLAAVCFTDNVQVASVLLCLYGAASGYYLMPFNAVLQSRGQALIGSGKAVAIQNMLEYAAMLTGLHAFTMATQHGVSPIAGLLTVAVLMATSITGLILAHRSSTRGAAAVRH